MGNPNTPIQASTLENIGGFRSVLTSVVTPLPKPTGTLTSKNARGCYLRPFATFASDSRSQSIIWACDPKLRMNMTRTVICSRRKGLSAFRPLVRTRPLAENTNSLCDSPPEEPRALPRAEAEYEIDFQSHARHCARMTWRPSCHTVPTSSAWKSPETRPLVDLRTLPHRHQQRSKQV